MTTTNIFKRLQELLPQDPLLVGEVLSTTPAGCMVQLVDGATLMVRGTATVGDMVFVRAGLIEGPAPDLDVVLIEV